MTAAESAQGIIRGAFWRQQARRFALFLGMLLSGGILLLPRLPLLALLVLVFLALQNPLTLFRRGLSLIWLVLLLVLTVALIGGGDFDLGATATRYANFIGGLLLLALYLDQPRSTLTIDLVPILRLMSVQCILTVAIAAVAPGLFIPIGYGDATYQTILLLFTYHDIVNVGSIFKRPDGFFFEPGVFQIYLNIFVYISLFVTRGARDVALGIVAVIATQSTTGLLIVSLLLGAAYLRRMKTAQTTEKLLVAVFAPIMIVPVALIAYYNLVEKTEGVYRGSAWARQYDFITGLRVLMESPITGIGFSIERYYEVAQKVGFFETQLDYNQVILRGNTNGIVSLAYTVGIPLFLMFMYGLFRQRFFPDRLIFGGVIFLGLIGESLALTPFFLMLIYGGMLGGVRFPQVGGPRTALTAARRA